ncbi:MAG TPA: single-stranded-DNA-specific exonuclease RecJ [Crocinitomix sp.]|nr:single-stranded-DNA-specific exonuclease RecJ [Crocinitomix sp.]
MKTIWELKRVKHQDKIEQLIQELNISYPIAKLLTDRGITNYNQAKDFFRPDIEKLHNPFLMKNMDLAVDRIVTALNNKENILVYGDYDVDGTTAVALMFQYLHQFTQNIAYYIPDRYKEGYGVSNQGVDFAIDNNFTLIIALDCGIKAIDKVKRAKQNGIDFIICDHHTPGSNLPDAIILNPKQKDCNYPYKELCGCGVGFKLVQALNDHFALPFYKIDYLLDLVMVAIGADIVSVMGENRIMCHYGLKKLNEKPRIGFSAILKLANKQHPLTVTDVVFTIAPRINAAGRIKSGNKAVELLLTETIEEADKIGKEIHDYNTFRRELDKEITQEALQQIENDEWLLNAKTTVVYNKNWHKGVVGIVASRLTETYYRPTIVLTESNGNAVGSVRSVKDFDVYEALSKCADLLEQFGGHKYAAGLTLKLDNLPAFKLKFDAVVQQTITKKQLQHKLLIDSEIDFRDIFEAERNTIPKFYRILKQFAPFGPDNMKPLFVTKNVEICDAPRLLKDAHLKMTLFQEDYPDIKIDAIGFNLGEYYTQITEKPFNIAYHIDENVWNGKSTLQLMIKDIRID